MIKVSRLGFMRPVIHIFADHFQPLASGVLECGLRWKSISIMAASSKILGSLTLNKEWTTVSPRHGKRKIFPKIRSQEEQQQPWVPTDCEFDPDGQSKLIRKLEICMRKVESSRFYDNFLKQMKRPEISDHFHRVLGVGSTMQMVIYGIGSIESYEASRLQLSLAILMKRKFSWIGEIEVFDPILSATEVKVLEALGCSVLSINEQGRRPVTKPTLFYMPHCEAELYNNLLQANWGCEQLNRIALFGNSFFMYESMSEFGYVESRSHILAVQKFKEEYAIQTISDYYFEAFHDLSWHFFGPSSETELPLVKN